MFSSDVQIRLQALEMRDEARRFLDGAGYPPGTPAAKLDTVLQRVPPWLLSDLSFSLFRSSYHTLLDKEAIEARIEMNLDPVVYAASGVGIRTFLRMRAGVIRNADILADQMVQEVAQSEARLAAADPKRRAGRRRYLREVGKREFGLSEAMGVRRGQIREAQQPLPPIYCEHDRIECPNGLTLRIPTDRATKTLARGWEDGWPDIAPENAKSGYIAPISQRLDLAFGMRNAGSLFGVFDGRELVGSVIVNRVSDTQVELGWFTLPAHRGRGIATSAVQGLLADLHRLGIEEAGARCFPTNQASMRVISKLGLVSTEGEVPVEGTMDWASFTGRTEGFALQRSFGM